MSRKKKSHKYLIWMSWRHLVSRKGESISIMTIISILGVAIGVATLVIVLSVMGGLENNLKQKMFKGLPHLEIMHSNPLIGFSLKEQPLANFSQKLPKNSNIEAYTKSDVLLKNGKNFSSAVLFGINPQDEGSIWGFRPHKCLGQFYLPIENNNNTGDNTKKSPCKTAIKHLDSKGFESYHETDYIGGVLLGEDLADQLGVSLGQVISILNPSTQYGNFLSGGQVYARFRVIGKFQTDLPHFDSKYAVVSINAGRKYLVDYDSSLDEKEFVSGIAINLKNPEQIDDLVPKLNLHNNLKITTWKDTNNSLLVALKLEKFTMGAILLLIILVAAFSISGTIMMTVFHKRTQISLMKALGMTKWDIAKLFLFCGLFIGSLGVIIGLLLGVSVCGFLYLLQFVHLPLSILSELPVKFLVFEYFIICSCAWILSLLAVVYPSLIAAKQDPVDGLRYL